MIKKAFGFTRISKTYQSFAECKKKISLLFVKCVCVERYYQSEVLLPKKHKENTACIANFNKCYPIFSGCNIEPSDEKR